MHGLREFIYKIHLVRPSVRDGARVSQRRTIGPDPEKTRFEKHGPGKNGDSEKRDYENGIRKTILGSRDSEKRDSEKTGFGLQADRARPSARQKLDHLCLCSVVATPELQTHQQEKVGNSLKEDLGKPGYKSKHENTKRSTWLEWCSHGLPTSINSGSPSVRDGARVTLNSGSPSVRP